MEMIESVLATIKDALLHSVPFAQFQNREKHP